MMDRDLSVQEAVKAGRIIMAGGSVLLILVVYQIVSGFSELDAAFSFLLALALVGCIWTIQKGYRLAFSVTQTNELMSIQTLYLMSAIMFALGIALIALGCWFNALIYAIIQSVMFFGIAMRLFLLAGRRRISRV